MKRLVLLALVALAVGAPALAQPADPYAEHQMPARTAPADPRAGHTMPSPSEQATDPHAGHQMAVDATAPADTTPADGNEAPPPIPTDHDADRYFPRTAMVDARTQLNLEHGAIAWSKVLVEKLEFRPDNRANGYAWEGRASFGGDIDRLVIKSRGEGARSLAGAEAQVLYGRAITPYFNLEAGVRQDFEPRTRTYLTFSLDGVAPYWFELNSAIFLSDRGDLTARAEAAYDVRLTQKLILEPRAEVNLAARDVPDERTGSGLSSLELGLRLRYAIQPEFAPYVGVNYEQRFGATARFARAAGEDRTDTRVVIGLRAWF